MDDFAFLLVGSTVALSALAGSALGQIVVEWAWSPRGIRHVRQAMALLRLLLVGFAVAYTVATILAAVLR